jgi:hypothetical protein
MLTERPIAETICLREFFPSFGVAPAPLSEFAFARLDAPG